MCRHVRIVRVVRVVTALRCGTGRAGLECCCEKRGLAGVWLGLMCWRLLCGDQVGGWYIVGVVGFVEVVVLEEAGEEVARTPDAAGRMEGGVRAVENLYVEGGKGGEGGEEEAVRGMVVVGRRQWSMVVVWRGRRLVAGRRLAVVLGGAIGGGAVGGGGLLEAIWRVGGWQASRVH